MHAECHTSRVQPLSTRLPFVAGTVLALDQALPVLALWIVSSFLPIRAKAVSGARYTSLSESQLPYLHAKISGPSRRCWDGKNLDSADHEVRFDLDTS